MRPSRAAIVWAIVVKDLREISRDRLWMFLTPFALALFIVIFWVLPDAVNETVRVGITPPELAETLTSLGGQGGDTPGLAVVPFEGQERLAAAVSGELEDEEADGVVVGIAFPPDFVAAVREGRPTRVTLYVNAAVPKELGHAMASGIRELAYLMHAMATGNDPLQSLPVSIADPQTIIVGEDRVGAQIPLRDKMRPLFAVVILMLEAIALAGLVAMEIEHRTATAVLVTPARTSDLLAAKSITGAILLVSQALVFLIATWSFGDQWLLVLVFMLLGGIMMSAVGMIAGAAGKDFMGTLFYSIVLIVPMLIPALATLFPGAASIWIKAMPSYWLVEAMVGAVGYGHGLSELAPHLAATLAWDGVLFGAALLVLRRKVEAT